AGYQQGAKFINDSIDITAVYSPDPTNPWGDIAGGKSSAQTLYAAGNDIIYAAAGGTGQGVMQAANESSDTVYAIGVDSDQDYLYPGKVLCSMLKLVETAVYESIAAIMDDTWDDDWAGSLTELGLAEGGVGISPMLNTTAIRDGDFTINGTTMSRYEWVQEIANFIKNGTITVSDIPEVVTTTTTTESGSTSGTGETTTTTIATEATIPGFEMWVFIPIIGVAAVINFRKRKK
ncbi:MAG: BMP family lipoprotein, partial [Candidatus Hodarchaeales archaeon]